MNFSRMVGMVLILTAGWGGQAWAQTAEEPLVQMASARMHGMDPGGASSADLFSSNGFFARFYAGFDYALLGDLTGAIQQTGAYYRSLGASVTAATSTDNIGVQIGTEWGQRMEDGSELSLATEFVSTQADLFSQFNSSNSGGESVGPNLFDVTLRYSFDLAKGSGNRTSLSLGGGWYHAIVDYNSILSEGVTEEPDASGAFTGDALGATANLREELQLGPFALGVAVYGRYAKFGQVNATDISGLAQRLVTTGPYTLADVNPSGNYWVLEPVSTQFLPVYQSTGLARPTVVDYSGLGGSFSLSFNF